MAESGNVETGDGTGAERRRLSRTTCSRLACSCTVKPESVSAATDGGKKRGALLFNISPDGISLETDFQPSIRTHMDIEISPIEGPGVAARLRVVRACRSARNGLYVIGAEFEEISEQDRQNLLALLDTIGRLEQDLSGA
jgi:hypothetical protein